MGASLQADEQEKRERADCARISETLNAQVDPTVVRWFFGQDAPILARVVLQSPINEDRALLGNLVAQMVALGASVPVTEVTRRLQVPIIPDGAKEKVFVKPAAPVAPAPESIAVNAAPGAGGAPADDVNAALRQATAVANAQAVAQDIAPVRERLADIARVTDAKLQRAAMRKFVADLPDLLKQIEGGHPATIRAQFQGMAAAIFNGLVSGAVEIHGDDNQPGS